MSWKKACLVYLIALMVTMLVNIEKVSVWVDDRLAEGPASATVRHVRRVRNLWRETGLAASWRQLDCAMAPYFDETYKNNLACREEPASDAAEEALRDRLDPNQPLLKPDDPIDAESLLAALSPPKSPVAEEGEGTGPLPAAPARPPLAKAPANGQSLTQAKAPAPHKLLVVGDSLAIGLSLSLRR
ncbi:MAG: DUF459 domain-containing protein, partial [Acidobacteriota bacterium]